MDHVKISVLKSIGPKYYSSLNWNMQFYFLNPIPSQGVALQGKVFNYQHKESIGCL